MQILKGVLAIITGIVGGGIVNMGLIMLGTAVIPAPEGVDPTNMESLQAAMPLFQPQHFITPFVAHAAGTLVGGFLASLIAASHKLKFALAIGVFFMIGGLVNVYLLNPPVWFSILDIAAAYLPMAWLGWKLSGKER